MKRHPSSGTKHIEHSLPLSSLAARLLLSGLWVPRIQVLSAPQSWPSTEMGLSSQKNVKEKPAGYVRLETNELFLHKTSVSTSLVRHLAGHTY